MNYEDLLIIEVVVDLNLKKYGVVWFESLGDQVLWNERN